MPKVSPTVYSAFLSELDIAQCKDSSQLCESILYLQNQLIGSHYLRLFFKALSSTKAKFRKRRKLKHKTVITSCLLSPITLFISHTFYKLQFIRLSVMFLNFRTDSLGKQCRARSD